jgi:hypothetical protein
MLLPRLLFMGLSLTGVHAALAVDARCELKHIVAEADGIRVSGDSTAKVSIRWNGRALQLTPPIGVARTPVKNAPQNPWSVLLKSGDTLEITDLGDRPDRCVVEPVIGPRFAGVSLTTWSTGVGTQTPIVLARTVRVDAS